MPLRLISVSSKEAGGLATLLASRLNSVRESAGVQHVRVACAVQKGRLAECTGEANVRCVVREQASTTASMTAHIANGSLYIGPYVARGT